MCGGKGGTAGDVLVKDPKGNITEKLLSGVFECTSNQSEVAAGLLSNTCERGFTGKAPSVFV